MASVLPKYFKKKIQSEYRLRLTTVICILVSLSLLAGIALLIPAYIVADAEQKTLQGQTQEVLRAGEEIVSKQQQDEAVWTRELLAYIGSQSDAKIVEPLIRKILEATPAGIRIVRLEYTAEETELIKLSGEAVDRRALTNFSEKLSSLPEIESVDLPLSNLVRSTDIPFSLEMVITRKETQ